MTDPLFPAAAIECNLVAIRQGIALLELIGTPCYVRRLPMVYNASIGGHLRHIIEHYQSFLLGLETGCLDYEKRARSSEIESCPVIARTALADVAAQMEALETEFGDRPLAYCSETAPGKTSPTALGRELEFLVSHTVHHYALVAVMCRLQGLEPAAGFGVAPSTLRYQQSLASCAPQAGG